MPGVRNGVLARLITTSEGVTPLGTVPPGFTWLLKTVHVLNTGGVPAAVTIGMGAADGGVQASLLVVDLEPHTAHTWEGWTALGPGDLLYISSISNVHVWCAGADLPGILGDVRATPFQGASAAR